MLIPALAEVKRSGGEYRTLKLYGQERNLITSGIARMNLFLHGAEDWVQAVIGLGPNLFYNSPTESCIVACNRRKPAARKGRVLFVDAFNEVTRKRTLSFLKPEHQQRILQNSRAFAAENGFAAVATREQIAANGANLSIPFYAKRSAATASSNGGGEVVSLRSAWDQWQTDGRAFWQQMDALVETRDGLPTGEVRNEHA
jgi:type I restriction enzyme M protein